MSNSAVVAPHRDGAVFAVTVQPRASRSEIVGIRDGALRVRIAAPPVDGAANLEVISVIAKALGVSKSCVEIVSGHSSRHKRVVIHGGNPQTISEHFGALSSV